MLRITFVTVSFRKASYDKIFRHYLKHNILYDIQVNLCLWNQEQQSTPTKSLTLTKSTDLKFQKKYECR